ncbi:MAG: translation initiation factor [Dehalococcoidia bacterium]
MAGERQGAGSRLVYSTDGGRVKMTPHNRRTDATPPPAQKNPLPDDGVVRVARAKSPRGGKTMTAVTGLPGADTELDALLKRFKASLGTGGTREARTLMFQGEQRERLMAELVKAGFKPKLAGG